MIEHFKNAFYWLDLLVGFGSPLLLLALIRLRWIDKLNWRIFWLGAAVGALWEIPIFLLSKHSSIPIVEWIRVFPIHYGFFLISHMLWDGAIFLMGVWFIKMVCVSPTLIGFRPHELAVLFVWGQLTAFLVEFSAVSNNAWAFIDTYWFNPRLVSVGDHSVTLMMQLIWLLVTVPFYLIVLRLNQTQLRG